MRRFLVTTIIAAFLSISSAGAAPSPPSPKLGGSTIKTPPLMMQPQQPAAAISLGGVSGFNSLADPNATTQYRATLVGTLYLHSYAADTSGSPGMQPYLTAIAQAFAGTAPGVFEASFGTGFYGPQWTSAYWTSPAYQANIIARGFKFGTTVVNIENAFNVANAEGDDYTAAQLAAWKGFVDAGRSAPGGPQIFAPIGSPNQSGGACGATCDAATVAVAHPWADTFWDNFRQAAIYGGGIAFDTPVGFYVGGFSDAVQQNAYKQWTKDALAWADANGLWSAVIVSPYFEQTNFLGDAFRMYDDIAAAGNLPSHWAVQNYSACGTPYPQACTVAASNFPQSQFSPVGTETTPNTEAFVALAFARMARVHPYIGAYAGALTIPPHKTTPSGNNGPGPMNFSEIQGPGRPRTQSRLRAYRSLAWQSAPPTSRRVRPSQDSRARRSHRGSSQPRQPI